MALKRFAAAHNNVIIMSLRHLRPVLSTNCFYAIVALFSTIFRLFLLLSIFKNKFGNKPNVSKT